MHEHEGGRAAGEVGRTSSLTGPETGNRFKMCIPLLCAQSLFRLCHFVIALGDDRSGVSHAHGGNIPFCLWPCVP